MSFPVDDITLNAVEHAMSGAYEVDEDGTHHWVGSEYSLSMLLDFLSGYDAAKLELMDGETEWDTAPIYTYPEALYSHHDLIRALIAEVRHLREKE